MCKSFRADDFKRVHGHLLNTCFCATHWTFPYETAEMSPHRPDSGFNIFKSNHFYCHITTAQVPWWVKFLWACSRQCRKTTDNLPMDRQCKKNKKNNNIQFTYGQTVQKNCTGAFTVLQTVQKKTTTTAIYIWTDSAKKQQQFTYGQYIFTDGYPYFTSRGKFGSPSSSRMPSKKSGSC